MEKKTVKIEIPLKPEYMTIKQANGIMEYFSGGNKAPDVLVLDKIELISIISGVSVKNLRTISIDIINQSYNLIKPLINRQVQEPKEEIEINGTVYVFSKKMGKEWSSGRFIDSQSAGEEIKENPSKIAAICYLPKGTEYDDSDVDDRARLFDEHFPGDAYIDLIGFFLQKYRRLSPGYSVLSLARKKTSISKAMKMIKQAR